MTRGQLVVFWIRYAEYTIAWMPIPISERPHYRVQRIDGEWTAVRR